MNFSRKTILILSLNLFFASAFCQLSILSGPKNGSGYQVVTDMVKVLGDKNGLKLSNRATGGGSYNFLALVNPSSSDKVALISADYLNMMIAEDRLNNTYKTASLRVLMPIAKAQFHLMAKKSSGLHNLQDLKGKKVGVGNKDQSSVSTASVIKERSKVDWIEFNVGFDEMLKNLANGTIDAGFIGGPAPIDLIDIDPQVMVDGISLIELTDFNGWAKYYDKDTIYKGDYKWLDKDVPTFSVKTLLVVNDSKLTSDEKKVVDAIASGIVQNLPYLKMNGHSAWSSFVVPEGMEVAPVKKQETTVDEVVYRVQVYSKSYEKQGEQIVIKGVQYPAFVYSYSGAFRYTVGQFNSNADAAAFQKECRNGGYDDAFVVAFKNNVRSTDPALFK